MIVRLCKNPKFITGFAIVMLLLLFSFTYNIFFEEMLPQTKVIYGENGNAVSSPPHSPLSVPPLGTDMVGNEMFFTLIKGAKYTIGIALVVAALRLFLSVGLSFLLESYFPKINRYLSKVTEAFHYVPISLLTFIILSPVLIEGSLGGFQYSFWDRVSFEIFILTIVSIPTLTTLLSNEMKVIYHKDFIAASKIIGANKWFLYYRHILPFLTPKIWIQYTQQVVQVLILLVHLGLLNILFGGARASEFSEGVNIFISITSEWSGLIGSTYQYLWVAPWIPLAPLIMFSICILSLNMILEGIKSELQTEPPVIKKTTFQSKIKKAPLQQDFEFIN